MRSKELQHGTARLEKSETGDKREREYAE